MNVLQLVVLGDCWDKDGNPYIEVYNKSDYDGQQKPEPLAIIQVMRAKSLPGSNDAIANSIVKHLNKYGLISTDFQDK